jgi:hypothetical protein
MLRKLTGLLLGVTLLATAPAQAAPVRWIFSGVFDEVDRSNWSDLPADIAVGRSFELTVSFDTATLLRNKLLDPKDGSGYRYNFFNNSLGMSVKSGAVDATFGNDVQQDIIVRDGYYAPDDPSKQVDGISFSLTDEFNDQLNGRDIDMNVSLIMRSLDLSLLTVLGDLMPTQAFDVSKLFVSQFYVCRYDHDPNAWIGGCGDYGHVSGVLTSMRAVPEPSTMLLAALALFALSLQRRRCQG